MGVTIYEVIAQVRRDNASPSGARALDMVVAELGKTGDDLGAALENLRHESVPPGGWSVLTDLRDRARRQGVDVPDGSARPLPGETPVERIEESTAGIAALLAVSSLAILGLGVAAVVAGVLKATGH